jgi:benzoyl-CoA 2,3-dioxygenase component A
VAEQLGWESLPEELCADVLAAAQTTENAGDVQDLSQAQAVIAAAAGLAESGAAEVFRAASYGATTPPWSAAHAYTNLHGPKAPVTATVVGNLNCTEAGFDNETHHIVLDFGAMPFPVLEGQSLGIVPPGVDAGGKPHVARQYSIASARNGERPGYNNLALTVKRVVEDHQGQPVRGVASNYLCDLQVGDKVQVIGPFGSSFLMPNHPRSHIVMICTGTGSAPMRAMTEWRRRLRKSGKFDSGKLLLFFGARTPQELPYFGPCRTCPRISSTSTSPSRAWPASPGAMCRTPCASARPISWSCCATTTRTSMSAVSKAWRTASCWPCVTWPSKQAWAGMNWAQDSSAKDVCTWKPIDACSPRPPVRQTGFAHQRCGCMSCP